MCRAEDVNTTSTSGRPNLDLDHSHPILFEVSTASACNVIADRLLRALKLAQWLRLLLIVTGIILAINISLHFKTT